MAIFEAVLVAGILIGNVASPYLFYATNYATVFVVAATCCILALIYGIYIIPESVENIETEVCFKYLDLPLKSFLISNIILTHFRENGEDCFKLPIWWTCSKLWEKGETTTRDPFF